MPRKLSIPAHELKDYIRAWAGKKTAYQMHQETGIALPTISNYAMQLQISLVVEDKRQQRERLINAITEHHETKTAKQIAELVGVQPGVVYYRAWIMGVKLKPDLQVICPEPIDKTKERFFNPSKSNNWLI